MNTGVRPWPSRSPCPRRSRFRPFPCSRPGRRRSAGVSSPPAPTIQGGRGGAAGRLCGTLGAPDRPCPDGAAPYRRAGARDPAAVARDGAAGDRDPARPAGTGLGGCGGERLALHDAPGDPAAGRSVRPVPARPASPGRPVAVAGRGRVRRAGRGPRSGGRPGFLQDSPTRPARRGAATPERHGRAGTGGGGRAGRGRRQGTNRQGTISPGRLRRPTTIRRRRITTRRRSVARTGPDLQKGDDDAIDASENGWMYALRCGHDPIDPCSAEEMALWAENEARLAALRPGIDTWEMAPVESGGAPAAIHADA